MYAEHGTANDLGTHDSRVSWRGPTTSARRVKFSIGIVATWLTAPLISLRVCQRSA